ncbi:MAG: prepilin-type N-terminal cleavage/methylation domain-containing protein [Planctomycetota bacterium]
MNIQRSKARRRGFTLVEILIVVVILGILAAIVVPQFTNAADDARAGNIQTQLSTIQQQVELFAARNNGSYPDFGTNGWDELTASGSFTANPTYLKDNPSNPAFTAAAQDTVAQGTTGTGSASAAWFFNTTDGVMYASNFNEGTNEVTGTATD